MCNLRHQEAATIAAVLQILIVTFPFFALVLAGFLAARRAMLPLEAIAGLNGYVLYFALPCMLFRFGATLPIEKLLDFSVALVYGLCALIMVGFSVAVTLSRRTDWNNAAFGALVAAFPNTGYMGIPLLVTLVGQAAAGPAIVTILIDMVMTSSLCIALSRLGSAQGGALVAFKNALRGMATNPMPWAILSGVCCAWWQWQPVAPVMKTIGLLADSASPVALFTIGAVLARARMAQASGQAEPLHWTDFWPVALLKLLLHPLLVILLGSGAIALGLPLGRFELSVLVLVAALPSASNVSLLAEKFGANTGRIAQIILVSTALAFFTFAAAVKLVAH